MPKDNIEKAVKKGQGANEGDFQSATYEGYGAGGVAVYVECMTDNLNRTVSGVRHIFSKYGGNLAKSGSLDFLFTRQCLFILGEDQNINEDQELILIDAGATDIVIEENITHIIGSFGSFGTLQKQLEGMDLAIDSAEAIRSPLNTIDLDAQIKHKVLGLLSALEDNEDVQRTSHNMAD